MFTPETLEIALHRFRTHPVQMGLTLLGLVVGTAAIIVIVALGLTGRTFVMSQIEGVGSHLVWASYEGTVTSGVSRTLEDQITDSDVRALEARQDFFSGVHAAGRAARHRLGPRSRLQPQRSRDDPQLSRRPQEPAHSARPILGRRRHRRARPRSRSSAASSIRTCSAPMTRARKQFGRWA